MLIAYLRRQLRRRHAKAARVISEAGQRAEYERAKRRMLEQIRLDRP